MQALLAACLMTLAFLLVLSAANFVIGFGAFVVIGLVEPIAQRYDVSPALAGQALTAYAIAYAIGSPLAIAITGRLPRRIVLALGMGLFALGSLASAFAPSLAALFAARVLCALGGGIFTPAAAAVGAALAAPDQRARTLSTIFAGLTLAQVVGVPAGAWFGYAYGPMPTFLAAGFLALIAGAAVLMLTPREMRLPPTSLAALGKVLTTPHLIAAVSFSATFLAAIYVVYTYLGPLLTHLYGLDKDAKSLLFLIYGSAAVLGNFVGGWSTNAFGASRTLLALAIAQVVMLYLVPGIAMGVAITAGLLFLWSLSGWSFMTPQQTRLVSIAPSQVQPLFALNASCIYIALAIGSAIGSATIERLGYAYLGLVAALCGLVAIIHLIASDRLTARAKAREKALN
jgi:MFS transporter, DHA1 family, inner membrane transport protein